MVDIALFDDAWANSAEGPVLFVKSGRAPGDLFNRGEHSHSRGQLLASLSGLLYVGFDSSVWVVPTVHAVWIPPHQRHSARSGGDFHGWSVYIKEEACKTLPDRPCAIRISALMHEAILRAGSWDPFAPLSPAGENVIAVILDEISSQPVDTYGLPMPKEPRLQRIAQALVANPSDDRGLEEWAGWGAVSDRTLSRRFVQETGLTFTAWRQRARLLKSLELLSAGGSITGTALELGYSAAAFGALFRKTFGETPAGYRRRSQSDICPTVEEEQEACPRAVQHR